MTYELLSFANFQKVMEILVIGLEIVYCVLAFVAVRQVRLMCNSFSTKAGGYFIGFSQIHFLFSIGILVLSLLLF